MKGGHHRIYSPAMNKSEFKQHIARTILESLMRDFPEEPRKRSAAFRPKTSDLTIRVQESP